ncbi:MAG: 3-ketoacyl-ACP reductase [Candidatus Aminicenantes bacterium]|nr:3-ketoacyl-ACP reductase [Candidatus Aminicenantes bacterium]
MSEQRVALVTGASRGIGRGIAIELAKKGFSIAGNASSLKSSGRKPGLSEVKQKVEQSRAEFLPVPGDISDLECHEKLIQKVLNRFGKIHVLVNNAGVAPQKRKDILDTTPESFDRLLSVNLRSAFFLTQRVARFMIRQKQQSSEYTACIIFISSVSAEFSSPSRAEYCISKAGLSQAARIFADRLAEYGINVYELRPGIIDTDMTRPVQKKYDRLIKEGLVPQKRWGTPQDVGKAVAALAQGYLDYSTGAVIEVSGGMSIRRL